MKKNKKIFITTAFLLGFFVVPGFVYIINKISPIANVETSIIVWGFGIFLYLYFIGAMYNGQKDVWGMR